MLMGATGLRTHIWNNNLKSGLLLAGFPVLLTFIGLAISLLIFGVDNAQYSAKPGAGILSGYSEALEAWPLIAAWSIGIAAIWFVIAWFAHQAIINASTGARSVTRQQEPKLYNLLENLCISRGLTMPKLAVIETGALNAYASGLNDKQYTITVTRGLMETLDDAELEGVLAHELSHIRHRDVRLLVISVIFVGIISFVFQILFRGLLYGAGGRRSGGRSGGAAIIIAMVIIAVAYLLAILIRFSLSRSREYMADAGAVELTKNPDAMISALNKISGNAEVKKAPDEVKEMFIENPHTGFMGMFATHPPMEKRIEALIEHAGGKRQHPSVPQPRKRGTSVPEV